MTIEERFMRDIPSTLDEFPQPVTDEETLEHWSNLKKELGVMQARRQQLFDEYNLVMPINADSLAVRLNLLVLHGLGSYTSGRFEFERDWTKALLDNAELMLVNASAERRARHLHLANGEVHLVKEQPDDPEE